MTTAWTSLLLFLVTITTILQVQPTESCTCWASSTKASTREHFCWSKFVAVVNITTDNKPVQTGTPCGDNICNDPIPIYNPSYDFKIIQEFTPKRTNETGVLNRINTGRGGGDCGTRFNAYAEYLIFSEKQPDANGMYVGICEYVKNWGTLAEDKRQELIKAMKADTPCEPGIPDRRDPIFESRPYPSVL